MRCERAFVREVVLSVLGLVREIRSASVSHAGGQLRRRPWRVAP